MYGVFDLLLITDLSFAYLSGGYLLSNIIDTGARGSVVGSGIML
jgi:hypothetical protein